MGIDHLDFEFYPACENMQEDCENPAAWKIVIRCCGAVLLICSECKAWDDWHQRPVMDEDNEIECLNCGEFLPPSEHRLSVEPLECLF